MTHVNDVSLNASQLYTCWLSAIGEFREQHGGLLSFDDKEISSFVDLYIKHKKDMTEQLYRNIRLKERQEANDGYSKGNH